MQISPAQASWFRLRRSGLAVPFDTPEEAAQSLAGVQAQDLTAAGLALCNRTRGLDLPQFHRLLYHARTLVRLWGHRNTLHLYSTRDWPLFHAALQGKLAWFEKGFLKRGGDPRRFEKAVQKAARRLRQAETLSRNDVKDLELELEALSENYWSGLFQSLERRGLACHAGHGPRNETRFAHREVWTPALDWRPPSREDATAELTRRYFRSFGPASAADLGYWWGGPATQARRWIEALRGELTEVHLQGETLFSLTEDLTRLTESPPPPHRWPIRLLSRFDLLLLGLKDKSWLIPERFYKKVWKSSAQVEAVLLVKGRIAGTWRGCRLAQGLQIIAHPFVELNRTVRDSLHAQARNVARFHDLPLAAFEMTRALS